MSKIIVLRLSAIRAECDLHPRTHVDDGVVQTYADAVADGIRLPPVRVISNGSDNWLVDGFHRLRAYEQAGFSEIEAEVVAGDYVEAVRHAVRANATNGRNRALLDLKRAFEIAMRHGLVADPPAVENIAEVLACSRRSAYRLLESRHEAMRRERDARIRAMHDDGAAQRHIAGALGVGRNTVRRVVYASDLCEQRQAERDAEETAFSEVAALTPGLTSASAMATNSSLSIFFNKFLDMSPQKAAAAVLEHEKRHRIDQATRLLEWLIAFRRHLQARPSPVRH